MTTKVQKWGNSLAVRIPNAFAVDANLSDQSVIDVSIVDGKLVISPTPVPVYTLDELLAGVTDENRHDETDFGPAVGNEIW